MKKKNFTNFYLTIRRLTKGEITSNYTLPRKSYAFRHNKGTSENDARLREMFWQYKLDTFLPDGGLNNREVDFKD